MNNQMLTFMYTLLAILATGIFAGIGAFFSLNRRFRKIEEKTLLKEAKDASVTEVKNLILKDIQAIEEEPIKAAMRSIIEQRFEQISVLRIYMGSISLGGTLEGKGRQQTERVKEIRFPAPGFSEEPEVSVSLRKIDMTGKANIHRLEVHPREITKDGFNLVFKTWLESRVYAATATWIAVGYATATDG